MTVEEVSASTISLVTLNSSETMAASCFSLSNPTQLNAATSIGLVSSPSSQLSRHAFRMIEMLVSRILGLA